MKVSPKTRETEQCFLNYKDKGMVKYFIIYLFWGKLWSQFLRMSMKTLCAPVRML